MSNTEARTILPNAIAYFEALDFSSPQFDKEIEPHKHVIQEIYDRVRAEFIKMILFGQEIAEDIWRGFIYLHDLFVKVLKRKEDFVHRQGMPKDVWRSNAFNSLDHMGGFVAVNGRLEKLDYRPNADKAKGEVGEAAEALLDYLKNPQPEKATNVLIELSDTIMNVVQTVGTESVLSMFDDSDPKFSLLVLTLIQVAELKFNYRYLIKGGKNEDEEKKYVEEKLAEANMSVALIMSEYEHLFRGCLFTIHQMSKSIVIQQAKEFFGDDEQGFNFYLENSFYDLDLDYNA